MDFQKIFDLTFNAAKGSPPRTLDEIWTVVILPPS
jgi:hypothetical protein